MEIDFIFKILFKIILCNILNVYKYFFIYSKHNMYFLLLVNKMKIIIIFDTLKIKNYNF